MSVTECPIECIKAFQETWLEKHESFMVTLIGTVGAILGMCLQCLLRSRCTRIQSICVTCDRDVDGQATIDV